MQICSQIRAVRSGFPLYSGTLTRNDMAVVRMRLGGRDWGDLQQLPSVPRPAHDPLGLKRPVLRLLGENIAANSTAALELSRDAPGTAPQLPLRLTNLQRSQCCCSSPFCLILCLPHLSSPKECMCPSVAP
jgi:hypothetical protein